MPRNVRNFWLDVAIDGRASRFASGPRNRNGGLSGAIYQRAGGEIVRAVTLDALALSDGGLRLDVSAGPDRFGPLLAQIFTHRDTPGVRVERPDAAALREAAEALDAAAAAFDTVAPLFETAAESPETLPRISAAVRAQRNAREAAARLRQRAETAERVEREAAARAWAESPERGFAL